MLSSALDTKRDQSADKENDDLGLELDSGNILIIISIIELKPIKV